MSSGSAASLRFFFRKNAPFPIRMLAFLPLIATCQDRSQGIKQMRKQIVTKPLCTYGMQMKSEPITPIYGLPKIPQMKQNQ